MDGPPDFDEDDLLDDYINDEDSAFGHRFQDDDERMMMEEAMMMEEEKDNDKSDKTKTTTAPPLGENNARNLSNGVGGVGGGVLELEPTVTFETLHTMNDRDNRRGNEYLESRRSQRDGYNLDRYVDLC